VFDHLPVVAITGVLGWAYLRGTRRVRSRTGKPHPWQAVAFFTALAALLLVLVTPIEHLAQERLWAHMVQHVILVGVVAPLAVLANPVPPLLWALPAGARRGASPLWRRVSRSHSRPEGWVAWAVVAIGVHAVSMWAWHAPAPYQAALRSEWLHSLQHATFLATATFFWWSVVGARRRSLYGPGVLAVFAAALQGTALGAFMTFAGRVWYPVYAQGAGAGLTPLEDQQVAGVIMWGPGGIVYLVAAVLLFAAWLGGNEGVHTAGVRVTNPAS
jgi:putative membrane protein